MNQIETRLSYLMNLMDVSGKELAIEIGTDTTTISKWKNGQRKLKSRSPYALKLTEYFLSELFAYQRNYIIDILDTSGYEVDDENEDELVQTLKIWLTEEGVTSSALSGLVKESQEDVNYVEVYKGYDGWKKALNIFWNVVNKLSTKEAIYLGDFGDVQWDNVDSKEFEYMIDSIIRIAHSGHKVVILDYMTDAYKPYKVLLRWLPIYLNRNVEVRYIYKVEEEIYKNCIYIVDHNLVFKGMSINDNEEHITLIHRDDASISFYDKVMALIIKNSERLIYGVDLKSPFDIIKVLEDNFKEKQITYTINHMPTFLNMSQELLKDILDDNEVSEDIQEICLKVNKSRCELRKKNNYIQIYNLDEMEKALKFDDVIDYDLSVIVGKNIKIKKDFFKRHLEYLMNVSNSECYTMVLTSFDSLKLNVDKSSIIVQDDSIIVAWNPKNFDRAIYCKELTFIGGYYRYLRDIWQQIPPIAKSEHWRKKQLDRMINEIG